MRSATCECGNTIMNDTPEMLAEIKIEEDYHHLREKQKERFPEPETQTRVRIFKIKKEISDDIEIKNQKSNPFGWSQSEIWYKRKRIGFIESGGFHMDEGYLHTKEKEPLNG